MRFSTIKISLLSLYLGLSVGCQRTWYRKPALQKTSVAVGANVTADAQVEKMIVPYRAQVNRQMSEVIGSVPVALGKFKLESPVGNFVADLQRVQAGKLTGMPVDIGLITAGGIRTPLRQGKVTVGDIFELMPFENELMVITVPAFVVQELVNYASLPHINSNPSKTLSSSNITYQILNNQPRNILIGGLPLDSSRTYTIALSDYLANGGDNLDFIKKQINSQKTGILLRDAIIKHIKELTAEGKPVEAKIEGRVQVIEPAPETTPATTTEPPK